MCRHQHLYQIHTLDRSSSAGLPLESASVAAQLYASRVCKVTYTKPRLTRRLGWYCDMYIRDQMTCHIVTPMPHWLSLPIALLEVSWVLFPADNGVPVHLPFQKWLLRLLDDIEQLC